MSHPDISDEDLAERALKFVYQIASLPNQLAEATARFIASEPVFRAYLAYVGEELARRADDLRREHRNRLICEAGMSATALFNELEHYAAGRSFSSLLKSQPAEGDPKRRLHDILVLNFGHRLKKAQIHNIISFRNASK